MVCPGVALLIVATFRMSYHASSVNVVMGFAIAVLGLTTNTWFWFCYLALSNERLNSVIAAQQKLYRAKALVDFFVTLALTAVAIAPTHTATQYIDMLGSAIVACYLLYNGVVTIRKF